MLFDDFEVNMKFELSSVKSLELRRFVFEFWEASSATVPSQNSKYTRDVPTMMTAFILPKFESKYEICACMSNIRVSR